MVKSTDKQPNVSAEQPKNKLNKNGDRRGMHPNSQRNLKSGCEGWQKGESGNPNGQSITAKQKQLMPEVCPFDAKGRTWLEALAEGGMRMALTLPTALDNLQDRHEGKVTQPVQARVEGEIVQTFNFILPDGSKLKPSELIKANVN